MATTISCINYKHIHNDDQYINWYKTKQFKILSNIFTNLFTQQLIKNIKMNQEIYYFEATNNLYNIYMKIITINFMELLLNKPILDHNIKFSWIIDYLKYQYDFKPFKIIKTGYECLNELENTSIINYIEQNITDKMLWLPQYDRKNKILNIFKFDHIAFGLFEYMMGNVNLKNLNKDNHIINYSVIKEYNKCDYPLDKCEIMIKNLVKKNMDDIYDNFLQMYWNVCVNLSENNVSLFPFKENDSHYGNNKNNENNDLQYENNNNNIIMFKLNIIDNNNKYILIIHHDQVMIANIIDHNTVIYKHNDNTFTINIKNCSYNIINVFEKIFDIKIPEIEYMDSIYYDTNDNDDNIISRLSKDGIFIEYNSILKQFTLNLLACDSKFFEIFEIKSGIKIPATTIQCVDAFKKYNVPNKFDIYYDNMIVINSIDDVKTNIISCNKQLNIRPQIIKNNKIVFKHKSSIYSKSLIDIIIVANSHNLQLNIILNRLFSVINISKLSNEIADMHFAWKHYDGLMDKFISTYKTGPTELTTLFKTNSAKGQIIATENMTRHKTFDIKIDKNGNYKIIVAHDEYANNDGELIVWKGIYINDNEPAIVKLILPKHALISPNADYLKFRTNNCKILSIHRLKLYKCYECDKCGIYLHKSKLYCTSCTQIIMVREKINNIAFGNILDNAVDSGYSIMYNEFIYHLKQEIIIDNFELLPFEICNKSGIYFFFRPEHVIDYIFKPNLIQTNLEILETKDDIITERTVDQDDEKELLLQDSNTRPRPRLRKPKSVENINYDNDSNNSNNNNTDFKPTKSVDDKQCVCS